MAVLFLGLAIGTSVLVNKSANNIEESPENDSIFYFEKNTSLPDDIEVFSNDDSAASTPALWRVTSSEGNTLYMIGTIHALNSSYYPISKAVGDAFYEASAIAVELKGVDLTDTIIASENTPSPYLEDGDTLSNHLTDEQYTMLSDYLTKNGVDISEYDGFAPWYVYQVYTVPTDDGLLREYGFDLLLQVMANIEDKEILSVETLESKQTYYPNMDERILGMLIMRGLTEEDNSKEIADLWAKGDLDALMEIYLSDEGLDAENKALWQQYLSYCYDERNEVMAGKAEEYLNSGSTVLMSVGTAHYAGENNIIDRLEAKGYTVERIE